MKRYWDKIRPTLGMPPGSVVPPVPDASTQHIQTAIRFIQYSETHISSQSVEKIADIASINSEKVTWIDISGALDRHMIQDLANQFHLHPLLQEDIVNAFHLPKVEIFPDCVVVIMKRLSVIDGDIHFDQVCFILKSNCVIAVNESAEDIFLGVRNRLIDQHGRIRSKRADYLLYALCDHMVDHYFESLRWLDQRIQSLEDQVSVSPTPSTLNEIQAVKKQVRMLKRYFWFLREMVVELKKADTALIHQKMTKYFSDLGDHVVHILDITESLREDILDVFQRYSAALDHRSNDIMKVLTLVAAIFLPLTFISGVYGMNFKYMPELSYYWAYPIVIGAMISIGLGLAWTFKRKRWFD